VNWDEDPLEYGYVLDRTPDGGWWHLHFALGRVSYPCQLLGCVTNILACVQRFGAGATINSPQFVLTLDGQEVRPANSAPLDFDWAKTAEAADFQRVIVPKLHQSRTFQDGLCMIVDS
jgi:hypothetical protein